MVGIICIINLKYSSRLEVLLGEEEKLIKISAVEAI